MNNFLSAFIDNCPLCLNPWTKVKVVHGLFTCQSCKTDLYTGGNKHHIYWLRKGFKTNYSSAHMYNECFYWVPMDENIYFITFNEKYIFEETIHIPFDITQDQLQTMINFQ